MMNGDRTSTEPLARYEVFRTSKVEEIASTTKRVSAEHERRILDDGPLSYHLNVARFDDFQLSWLRCNRDMEITIRRRFPFYLLHFLEAGVSRYSAPGLDVVNHPGQAVILSPCRGLKIRHTAVTAFALVLPEPMMQAALAAIPGGAPTKEFDSSRKSTWVLRSAVRSGGNWISCSRIWSKQIPT